MSDTGINPRPLVADVYRRRCPCDNAGKQALWQVGHHDNVDFALAVSAEINGHAWGVHVKHEWWVNSENILDREDGPFLVCEESESDSFPVTVWCPRET